MNNPNWTGKKPLSTAALHRQKHKSLGLEKPKRTKDRSGW
jgi:hypothetical protein